MEEGFPLILIGITRNDLEDISLCLAKITRCLNTPYLEKYAADACDRVFGKYCPVYSEDTVRVFNSKRTKLIYIDISSHILRSENLLELYPSLAAVLNHY